MFIEKVTIEGILSYKNRTIVEGFARGCSIVVGANGSGKSSFIFALGLIFNPKYWVLTKRQRLFFLSNQGRLVASRTGFVEVVINNDDMRLSTADGAAASVTIGRTITETKDQFRVNGEGVNEDFLKCMLESAGFSSRNPYFFIPQGQINEIALQSPEKHLVWLREMSGMTVYEELKKQGQAMCVQVDRLMKQGDFKISLGEENLQAFNVDMEKLRKFNNCKSKIGAITFVLHEHKVASCKKDADKYEQLLKEAIDAEADCCANNSKSSTEYKRLRDQYETIDLNYVATVSKLEEQREEYSSLVKKAANFSMQMADLRKQKDDMNSSDRNLNELKEELQRKREELQTCSLSCDELKGQVWKSATTVSQLEEDHKNLCKKEVLFRDFASVDDRDDHIRGEIEKLAKRKCETEQAIHDMKQSVEGEIRRKAELTDKLEKNKNELAKCSEELSKNTSVKDKLKTQQLELVNQMRVCDLNTDNAERELSIARRKSTNLKRLAYPYSVLLIYDDLTRSLQMHFSEDDLTAHYKGMVIDNLRCPEEIRTAVETVAGLRLFSLIVDNDAFAVGVVQAWNADHKKGRLSFIALNRLTNSTDLEPYRGIHNAVPLIDQLDLNPNDFMAKVLHHILGKTLLCSTIEVCVHISQLHKLDCVTLDGDFVSARGLISGGCTEEDRSPRLTSHEKFVASESNIALKMDKKKNEETKRARFEGELRHVTAQIERLSIDKQQYQRYSEKANHEIVACISELEAVTHSIKQDDEILAMKKASMHNLDVNLKFLREELGGSPAAELNSDEQNHLNDLAYHLNVAKRKYAELLEKRKEAQIEMIKLERSTIPKLENEIEKFTGFENTFKNLDKKLKALQADDDVVRGFADNAQNTIRDAEQHLTSLSNERDAAQTQLNARMGEDHVHLIQLTHLQRLKDEAEAKFKRANQRLKDARQKLAETPTPTAQLLRKYSGNSIEELYSVRQRFEKQKSGIGEVNFAAERHILNVANRMEQLKVGHQRLARNREESQELVDTNEAQSESAIRLTFAMVKSSFEAVFTQLVPCGKANMRFMIEGGPEQIPFDEELIQIDHITGIRIKATFNTEANGGRLHAMERLSGGQKSLVALAILFAVQSCDPTPFYIFDEVDQHLDNVNTAALADFIRRKCEDGAQVIMSTFDQQILGAADAFFSVTYANRTSTMRGITIDDARGILNARAQPGGRARSSVI